MRAYVSEKKVKRVRHPSMKLLLVQRNRRLVNRELLKRFCAMCVSLTLSLPLTRLYTRPIYFDMAGMEQEERE